MFDDSFHVSEVPADQPIEDWEVLTQFALAAMMMLGFAVATAVGRAGLLGDELDFIRRTPAGILAIDEFEAKKAMQFEKLKSAWLGVRDQREFNRRLDALDLKVQESDNWHQVAGNYTKLCNIAADIFLPEGEGAKRHSVVVLMTHTCNVAELTPALPPTDTEADQNKKLYQNLDSRFGDYQDEYRLSEQQIEHRDDKHDEAFDRTQWDSVAHPANLRKLAKEIHSHTMRDRQRLARLQLELLTREVSAAPISAAEKGLSALEVLRRDVDRFDAILRLLPEVKQGLME